MKPIRCNYRFLNSNVFLCVLPKGHESVAHQDCSGNHFYATQDGSFNFVASEKWIKDQDAAFLSEQTPDDS